MYRLEEKLKPLIMQNVEFCIDDKSIRKGFIKVFNTKQFFIKFKLHTEQGDKDYELPYPYKVLKTSDGYLFDYSLSAFIPKTEEVFWKIKLMDRSESSKLYDNYLFIRTLSA